MPWYRSAVACHPISDSASTGPPRLSSAEEVHPMSLSASACAPCDSSAERFHPMEEVAVRDWSEVSWLNSRKVLAAPPSTVFQLFVDAKPWSSRVSPGTTA